MNPVRFFNRFLVAAICSLFFIPLNAQHFEVGLGLGPTAYNGDLSVHSGKDIFGNMHVNGTVFGKYYLSPYLNLGLSASYGRISGDDRYAETEELQIRNLNFQSDIIEMALRLEFNIIGFEPYNFRSPWSPYLFAGIGGFMFNPEAEYQGNLIELQPLGTEGQGLDLYPERNEYDLTQIVLPFGLGVKIALSEVFTLGFEVGYRHTFTDYLDDVSGDYVPYSVMLEERGEVVAALSDRRWEYLGVEPMDEMGSRGSRNGNDGYIFSVLTISYHFLDTGLGHSRQRRSKKSGCYTL
nr:outer membrane beta-barrel protein [Saprospiraceae bacterium]